MSKEDKKRVMEEKLRKMLELEMQFEEEVEKLKAINKINCEIFSRIEKNTKEGKVFVRKLKSASLEGGKILKFRYKEDLLQMRALDEVFIGIPNPFKVEFPKGYTYFDLESIIDQICSFKAEKALGIIEKWKVRRFFFSHFFL